MTLDLQGTLTSRQLLVLGLLENLTVYLGRAPTFESFVYDYMPVPEAKHLDALAEAGLLEIIDGRLVRRYSWQPVAHLPGRAGDWRLGGKA